MLEPWRDHVDEELHGLLEELASEDWRWMLDVP